MQRRDHFANLLKPLLQHLYSVYLGVFVSTGFFKKDVLIQHSTSVVLRPGKSHSLTKNIIRVPVIKIKSKQKPG